MKSKEIRDLAVKTHDIEAQLFQNIYCEKNWNQLSSQDQVFLRGREIVLQELDEVLKLLSPKAKILDVGCGTGHLLIELQRRGFNVYGLEPSEQMLQFAHQNNPELEIKKAYASDIPYATGYFDLVIALEVFRYLDNEENNSSINEIHRVLNTNGIIFYTHVNKFATDAFYLFYHMKSIYCRWTKKVYPFCNFTSPRKQEKLLEDLGYASVLSKGGMFGSVRLAFKFGSWIGNQFFRFMSCFHRPQIFTNFYKNFSAHLILTGRKK